MDEVIEALADGKYHTVYDLMEKTQLNIKKIGVIAKFLLDYGFVKSAEGYAFRIQWTPPLQEFWRKIKWTERMEHQRLFSRS